MDLNSKVVIVTGASVGIGKAVCKALVVAGAKVVGCSRNIQTLNKVAEEINSLGGAGELRVVQCDVTKEEDLLNMFSFVEKEFVNLHAIVNNAGMAENEPLLTGVTAGWMRMLQVNVVAVAVGSREAVKMMKRHGVDDGHIINISSMSAHRVQNSPHTHFYAATKHALKALIEGFRQELRTENSHIRVTSISPGNVNTEFTERLISKTPEQLDNYTSKFVELEACDMADAVIYAMTAPDRVNVSDIQVRPTEQDD